MIFKTFDSKIDKWTSKIGIFGKSFNELGTAINEAFKSAIDNLDNFDENVGFWESLKNNLFSKKADKDWIKNSLGDIISKENIDSYIAELDLDSAKDKLKDIFDWDDIIQNSDKSWQDYFYTLDDSEKYIVDLIKNTDDLSKLTGEDLVNANQQARESAIAHNETLKQQTFGAKAATVATKVFSAALNAVVFSAIVQAIGSVVSWINSYVDAAANAKESSETLTQKMKNFNSSVGENTKTIESLNGRYQELSKEVNNLGENVSLSASNYEEHKDIVQQISDIIPDLAVRFNAQGEVIGFTDGKLKDLTESYKKYRQEAAKDFLSQGDGEGNTPKSIVDNYQNQTKRTWYDNLWGKIKKPVGWFNYFGDANNPVYKVITSFFGLNASLEDMMEAHGMSNRQKKEAYELAQKIPQDNFYKITEFTNILGYDVDEIAKMSDADFEQFKQILQQEADRYGKEIESSADGMKEIIAEKLYADDDFYESLDDGARDNIMSVVSGLDDELLRYLKIDDEIDAGNFAGKLIKKFSKNDYFSTAFRDLFDPELEELPVDNYISKIRSLIDVIGNAIGLTTDEQKNKFLIRLGFDDLDILENDYNNTINSAVDKWNLDDNQKKDLEKFFAENSINTQEELDAWEEIARGARDAAEAKKKYMQENISTPKSFSKAWDSLGTEGSDEEKKASQEAKEKLLELAKTGKLTIDAFKDSSVATQFLKDTGLSAEEATKKINELVDSTQQLSELKTGITAITSAYDEKKDAKDKRVGPDTLESMRNTLGIDDSWSEKDLQVCQGYNDYVQSAIANNKQLTFSAKAGQIALKGLATAGNMIAVWAVSKIFTYRKRATNSSYLITLFVYANDTHINFLERT